jgi:hypothetical protein
VGLAIGAGVGWSSTDVDTGLRTLKNIVAGAFLLSASAVAIAGLGYFCVWLGVRGTGILLALGIGVSPATLVAPGLGYSIAAARMLQIVTALLGTTTVVAVRLCSSLGPKAFEPWPDPPAEQDSLQDWEDDEI